MKEIIVWLIHTAAGTIGLVAATVALFAKKGTALHRKAGNYFTISMLIMLSSGFVAALLKESVDDMFLSVVVMYTVFTAWLTAHRKIGESGFLEYSALVWIVVIAIAACFVNPSWGDIRNPTIYPYWAGFAILCAMGDVHNLFRSGLSGIQRVIRHVWRIGFSLVWAALAFSDKIIKIQGSTIEDSPYIVAIPAILILLTMLYWIINILFFSRVRFASYGE